MTRTHFRCVASNEVLHTVQGKLGPTEQRQFHFVLRPVQGESDDPHFAAPIEIISMSRDTFTVGRNYTLTIEPAIDGAAATIQ